MIITVKVIVASVQSTAKKLEKNALFDRLSKILKSTRASNKSINKGLRHSEFFKKLPKKNEVTSNIWSNVDLFRNCHNNFEKIWYFKMIEVTQLMKLFL